MARRVTKEKGGPQDSVVESRGEGKNKELASLEKRWNERENEWRRTESGKGEGVCVNEGEVRWARHDEIEGSFFAQWKGRNPDRYLGPRLRLRP